MIDARDYGARGDGKSDDAQALQNAITASQLAGRELYLPARSYAVSQPIRFDAPAVVRGTPRIGAWPKTTLVALAPMKAVVIAQAPVHLHDVTLDGARKATDALWLAGAGEGGEFTRVSCVRALRDGAHLAEHDEQGKHAINDLIRWTDCRFGQNGLFRGHSSYAQGYQGYYLIPSQIQAGADILCDTEKGGLWITVHGLGDLTTLGIRPGDPVRIAEHYRMVLEIEPSRLRVSLAMPDSVSGMPFGIAIGDGYHEERSGDNSCARIDGGKAISNAGVGLSFEGAHNPIVTGMAVEYAPHWGIRIASWGNNAVLCASFTGVYFEAIGCRPWLIRSTQGTTITAPMDWVWYQDPIDYQAPLAVNVQGIYTNRKGSWKFGAAG